MLQLQQPGQHTWSAAHKAAYTPDMLTAMHCCQAGAEKRLLKLAGP
jgi:hypothetical protein